MRRLRLLGVAAVAVAVGVGSASAQTDPEAPISVKVVGFAAIFKNKAHVVHAPNGGVLRRCVDPRALAVVLDVANVPRGLPYQVLWTSKGKPVHTGTPGTSGYFDEKPTRIELSFRKSRSLPNGPYVFQLVVDGDVQATGKVTRKCAR